MSDALATWAKAVGVDDDEMSDLTARTDDFLDALKSELQQVLQEADADRGGDPILDQLEELLTGRVTPPLRRLRYRQPLSGSRRLTRAAA